MGQWGHLYGKRWRKRARYQLQIEPLCRMCASEGRIAAASVADHVIPHRGDINSFWLGELQSLCAHCHSSTKAEIERRGYSTAIGWFHHAVGETNDDLKALIAAAPSFLGPGFLLPSRNGELFRWCLANNLRVVAQATLMTIGLYNEPAGAYLPSILY